MVGMVGVRAPFDAQKAGFDVGDGGFQAEGARPAEHVPLPAAPGNRPAVLEQMAVAGIELLRRPEGKRRVGAEGNPAEHAAVGDQEEQAPIAGTRGPKHAQIGVELDETIRAPRRFVEIDNPLVRGQFRVDREVSHGRDPLVRTGFAPRSAVVVRLDERFAKSPQGHENRVARGVFRDGAAIFFIGGLRVLRRLAWPRCCCFITRSD